MIWKMGLILAVMAAGPLWALELEGPDFEPINWESRQLTQLDYNGDGRTDLSTINGVARAIDVYVQKESPELVSEPNLATQQAIVRLSRFDKQTIALESAPASFAWGHFGGGEDIELAYVSVSDGLTFMQRDSNGTWRVKKRLGELKGLSYTHNLWVGKLSEETPEVMVGLFKGEIAIISNYQVVARYATLQNTPTFLNLTDINHDGRLDIICEYRSPTQLSYRLQNSNGEFSAEELVSYPSQTEKVFAFEGQNWTFFGGHESYVRTATLTPDTRKPKVEFYGLDYAASAVTRVDIDNDGVGEWVLCDPQRGVIDLWKASKAGWRKMASFPTFKGVTDMSWDGQRLWVYSRTERVVGYSQWNPKSGRMEFPKIKEFAHEPQGLVEGLDSAWVVQKQNDKFYLEALRENAGGPQLLEGIKRDPEAYIGFRKADGKILLVVLQPRDAALFYEVGPDAKVRALKVSSALTVNILNNIDKRSLGFDDIDADGKGELLLASRDLLRVFKITENSVELVDQALSSNTAANLRLPMMWEGLLWAYDSRHNEFLGFEQDDNGVWVQKGEPLPSPVEALRMISTNPMEWVVLAKSGFFVLKPHTPAGTLQGDTFFRSDLNIKGYNWGLQANMAAPDKPAKDFYLLYNQRERILEFVEVQAQKSRLNFKLYDKDVHYSGRKGEDVEPREMLVSDLTADGLPDVVMLMHDKLVVYPQTLTKDSP